MAAEVSVAESSPALDLIRALVETTKPRITRLVTITAAVGFVMAAVLRSWTVGELLLAAFGCLAGTGLSAAGANALNQLMERERDARMPRTARRPLPEGRATPRAVLVAGVGLCAIGVLVLLAACGLAAATVSLATILIYLLVYTPLKPVTPLATLVGAVPGALPPLIGWAGASPELGFASLGVGGGIGGAGGWSLFILMFVWQIPHFLAIAWLYKGDYEQGGHKVMPVLDPTGRATGATIFAWTLCLVPATVVPALIMRESLSWIYMAAAVVTGLAFLAFAARLSFNPTRPYARSTFLASVIHLPILLVAMVADAMTTLIR